MVELAPQPLSDRYGDTNVTLSSANTFSYEKLHVRYEEYLDQMMAPRLLSDLASESFYHFGDNDVRGSQVSLVVCCVESSVSSLEATD